MADATFRFYSSLNDFLPARQRAVDINWPVSQRTSVKDVIESLGVPHPEIGLLLANGQSIDFTHLVRPDDTFLVYPLVDLPDLNVVSLVQPPPLATYRFVLDTHLGKLATYLRMLGIDTLYRNDYTDPELAEISSTDDRVLLTRDRELLMRSRVTYGYYVRSTNPKQQLSEIISRYPLADQIHPFQRCLVCNGSMEPVAKETVKDQLSPLVREGQQAFWRCDTCNRLYWEGTHFQRMQAFIQALLHTNPPPTQRYA
ncbi:Mut7-C RNAse domain-containing protein [Spirosoma sp. KUDC1026]|uniref:Mut7-C RNAse domain-containing protein n=1 Tax=Spirosoma sp. KUDC1026 TaxID=2745947 RepID=UPI00159B8AC4|nr:Mut7-C RNAse domain-containing protein [Spirosoma sp. KUDC1026]QKZ15591.1 Mut7-C ubiquitin/RNAse domain-containing protein [Spirosoma sp. KUDC1026]